jgi:hypothetical protein
MISIQDKSGEALYVFNHPKRDINFHKALQEDHTILEPTVFMVSEIST